MWDTEIEVQEEIVLSHHLVGASTFELCGIVYHLGSKSNTGQYTCSMNTDVGWKSFENEKCVNRKPTLKFSRVRRGKKPYLLFYKKMMYDGSSSDHLYTFLHTHCLFLLQTAFVQRHLQVPLFRL